MTTNCWLPQKNMIFNSIPLGRFGTPDEIAKLWCFSHPMTLATSRERNFLWMAVSHRCRLGREKILEVL
jgi:hypothetical protein